MSSSEVYLATLCLAFVVIVGPLVAPIMAKALRLLWAGAAWLNQRLWNLMIDYLIGLVLAAVTAVLLSLDWISDFVRFIQQVLSL